MASTNEHAHDNKKVSAEQKSLKPADRNLDALAQQQTLPTTTIQRVRLEPGSLTPHDMLQLQRTIGNRAVGKLLTKTDPRSVIQAKLTVGPVADKYEQEADRVAQQVMSTRAPTSQQNGGVSRKEHQPQERLEHSLPATALTTGIIQRVTIQQNTIAGLTANLDTTNLDAAKVLINTLFDSGKRKSLAELYSQITQADKNENTDNNKKLIAFLNDKLQAETSAAPENAQSGFTEKAALKYKYWSATATDNVVQAGLRMWVTGDPTRGIGWNMIGKHLRGRLAANEYEQIGTMTYLLADQANHTNLEPTFSAAQKIQAANAVLDAARDDIRGALDALPDHDGLSYRQAGVANSSVYGERINVGDYIRDTTFWSTSALRISGSAGNWGTDGTAEQPKVYFIITGSTGKYISKYAGQEEGQHEVLFKNLVTFQVTKIANFRKETFFVHVTEVDPATLPHNYVVKNPYDGT